MILAQIAETDTTTYNEALTGAAGGAIAGAILFFIVLAIVIQFIVWAGMWKTASKAGQVGILACIPIVQVIIWLLIAQKPLWWILLFFVPLVNIVVIVIVMNGISNRFWTWCWYDTRINILAIYLLANPWIRRRRIPTLSLWVCLQ